MKPNHIAIIPDGNRRWAKKKGLETQDGHRAGMEAIEKILEEAKKQNIKYLTAWGCSRDNLTKRSASEVKFLYFLFEESFNTFINSERIHKDIVRI